MATNVPGIESCGASSEAGPDGSRGNGCAGMAGSPGSRAWLREQQRPVTRVSPSSRQTQATPGEGSSAACVYVCCVVLCLRVHVCVRVCVVCAWCLVFDLFLFAVTVALRACECECPDRVSVLTACGVCRSRVCLVCFMYGCLSAVRPLFDFSFLPLGCLLCVSSEERGERRKRGERGVV